MNTLLVIWSDLVCSLWRYIYYLSFKVLAEWLSPTNRVTLPQSVPDLCSFNTGTLIKEWVIIMFYFSEVIFKLTNVHFDDLQTLVFSNGKVFCCFPGWSEAIRIGRPTMWWMPWCAVCWQICAIFLRKRHMPAVLLRTVLGYHTFQTRAGISQASGQGRRWPTKNCSVQMVKKHGKYNLFAEHF